MLKIGYLCTKVQKNTIYKILNQSDERCRKRGQDQMDGRTDGWTLLRDRHCEVIPLIFL